MTIDKFYLDDANVLCLIEHTPCVLNMYSIHRYSWITAKEDLQSSKKIDNHLQKGETET